MPTVLRFNASAASVVGENKFARLRQAMGLATGADVADVVSDMNRRLGLPPGLAAVGVEEAMFDTVIAGALKDHCHKTNVREASAADYRRLLLESL